MSTVTAMLSVPSSEAVTLTVAAAGTNARSGDFTLSSARTLTIAAGQTTSTGTVTVAAVDDATDDPDKSVTVSAMASGGGVVAHPVSRTLTITDSENGGTATVTATLTSAWVSDVEVTVRGLAGAYTVGPDATSTPTTVC